MICVEGVAFVTTLWSSKPRRIKNVGLEIKEIVFLPLTFHGDYFNLENSSDGAYSWAETELNDEFYNYCKEKTELLWRGSYF